MNSKKKANIATGKAMAYFSVNGFTISLPVGDCEKYDLVVDFGKLEKIQCKYTSVEAPSGSFIAELRTFGGYRDKTYFNKYKEGDFDRLYIYCKNGNEYLIPWKLVKGMSRIVVGNKWEEYKIS